MQVYIVELHPYLPIKCWHKMPKLVVSDGTSEKYDSKDERTILLRYWQRDVPVADMLTLASNPQNWVLTTRVEVLERSVSQRKTFLLNN